MKTEFQGRYYNGVSSKPYPCVVKFEEHAIVIRLLDEFGGFAETLHWELEKVSKDDIEISDRIRLKYGSFPHQSVEIQDKELPKALNTFYSHLSFGKRDFVSIISRNWKVVIGITLLLAGFGFFAFKVIVPNMAEYAATKVPIEIERSIGKAAYNQLSEFTDEDAEKSYLVQQFFEAMHLDHKYSYTISVLDSKTVNAFAVPGGQIAIYSGILDEMENPEELAALLAHESAHVELQHSLKNIFRSLSGYFVISLLFGDMGGVTAVVFENIYVFQDLQYSRKMEKEADVKGLEYMQKTGINPNGMVELFNTINMNTSDSTKSIYDLSEFVSTHPLTKHRIKYIKEYIDKDTQVYSSNPQLDSLFHLIKKQ